ncbi:Tn7-like element transposition protein TnsE [Rheinheimera soli]|uniref:Tn7-like element transposition protein TnsE n=1 Tax=Rheinheimera soli TaxID=443616 RepID=UPI001E325D76|nr:Tn7-like element transposition protein TnsE [Rheinheimera soli]
MQKKLIKKIPVNARLVGLGNQFRRDVPSDFWHFSAYFNKEDGTSHSDNFDLEAMCLMGLGRTFTQNEHLFTSGGYRKALKLPPVEQWQEARLSSFQRLSKKLSGTKEVANQRCFLFRSDGLKVWLPKLELARKLFFHAGFLVRAAYQPNALDLMFNVKSWEFDTTYLIETLDANGAPVEFIRQPVYRSFLSWLLLNKDIRQSFNSIWQCLNQEQFIANGYCRWAFNFIPPAGLSGLDMDVHGVFNEEKNELLVWEINSIKVLPNTVLGETLFSHPKLKNHVRTPGSKGGGFGGQGGENLLIDTELEPSTDTTKILLDLLSEGLQINHPIQTKVKYAGERSSGYGKPNQDDDDSSNTQQVVGTKDDVEGGQGKAADFDALQESDNDTERFKDRFKVFIDLIKQLANEPDLELISLVVKPLPEVKRCHLHLMADGTERCYLLAKFVVGEQVRYVLEVDTSDNKRQISTRIFSLRDEFFENEFVKLALGLLLKRSLSWPTNVFDKHCLKVFRVKHPSSKEHYFGRWVKRLNHGVRFLFTGSEL